MMHPLDFFAAMRWLDGRPLLDTIESYRRAFHTRALYTFRPDGSPQYNLVLSGRAKKNYKTTDLVLAALYRFLAWPSAAGNDCFILANDLDQAGDDLSLVKKLIAVNGVIEQQVKVHSKEIVRRDGNGALSILPAKDVAGAHGKTALFLGFDEIHAYRSWDLFEALAPDPTRTDVLTFITSYDTIFNSPGVPLYDLKRNGKAGSDPRMLFSWYSADECTDPAFADLPPEQRANPSMASWPDGVGYLNQQRTRLPTHKFRRLHLNLPGAPDGAFFDGASIMRAIVPGHRTLPIAEGCDRFAFVDMSGGSGDDAYLGVASKVEGRYVLNLLVSQDGGVPFNPRNAVAKFVRILKELGITRVTGDAYAGTTFRHDFIDAGITYTVSTVTKSEIYEQMEPRFNAGEVELLDVAKLQEQLLTLVVKGSKIDHQVGDHDDAANAACGALNLAAGPLNSWAAAAAEFVANFANGGGRNLADAQLPNPSPIPADGRTAPAGDKATEATNDILRRSGHTPAGGSSFAVIGRGDSIFGKG